MVSDAASSRGTTAGTPTDTRPPGHPFVWAHRGASALAPENTVRAFLLAAQLGAHGVELDVQLSSDGVPVVLHDPFLFFNGDSFLLHLAPFTDRVWVAASTWEELSARPVIHPDGTREALPRLEEVLEAVPPQVWVDVELKTGAIQDPRLVGVVLACVRRRERVLISSFDHPALAEVAAAAPELPRLSIIHARPVDLAATLGAIPASLVCIDRPFLTAGDAMRWRDEGIVLYIGGKELPDDLQEVLTWPVAGVFLDDPRPVTGRQ